jgi:hypothetical protein
LIIYNIEALLFATTERQLKQFFNLSYLSVKLQPL